MNQILKITYGLFCFLLMGGCVYTDDSGDAVVEELDCYQDVVDILLKQEYKGNEIRIFKRGVASSITGEVKSWTDTVELKPKWQVLSHFFEVHDLGRDLCLKTKIRSHQCRDQQYLRLDQDVIAFKVLQYRDHFWYEAGKTREYTQYLIYSEKPPPYFDSLFDRQRIAKKKRLSKNWYLYNTKWY